MAFVLREIFLPFLLLRVQDRDKIDRMELVVVLFVKLNERNAPWDSDERSKLYSDTENSTDS